MFQRLLTASRLVGVLLAGGFLGLLTTGRAQAQDSAIPKISLVVAATSLNANDAAAVDKANKYLDSLKDEKNKDQKEKEDKRTKEGRVPSFPNPHSKGDALTTPADVAAAVTLPPIGVNEQLLSNLIARHTTPKPAAPRYRWAALKGDRELRIFGLKANSPNKTYWNEAKAAREKNQVYVHSRFNFPIYSREAAAGGGAVEFFMLVLDPGGELIITEKEIDNVRKPTSGEGIDLFFTQPDGSDALKKFTTTYSPAAAGTADRFMVLCRGNNALSLARVTEPIEKGSMRLGATGLSTKELDRMYEQLSDVIAKRTSTP